MESELGIRPTLPVCSQEVYKKKLCKQHYFYIMKREIRDSIKRMYRDPLSAYGTFDYFGEGKIMIKQLLNHEFFKNISNKYSIEDVKQWLYRDEVFQRLENDEDSFIDFIQFKKHFFPQVM